MEQAEQGLAQFVRVVARHSALLGDRVSTLLREAAVALRAEVDTDGAVALALLEPVGEDLLLVHELDLRAAVQEAGLELVDADPALADRFTNGAGGPVVVDDGGTAWLGLRGAEGWIGALRLQLPAGGWTDPDRSQAVAAALAGELGAALVRHWVEQQHLDRSAAMLEAQRHTHVGCFEWDIVADKVRWSDELFRIFGDPPQSFEPTFEEFLERIHEDDREAVRASVFEAYAERRDYRIEERIVRRDGEVRQLASWGHVIVGEDTVPVKIIGSCQDVTDFRSAMADLAEKSRRLVEAEARRAQALELNDNVVQGLATAVYALHQGMDDAAKEAVTGTLRSVHTMIGELLDTDHRPLGELALVRSKPAPTLLTPRPAPVPKQQGHGTRVVIADDSSDIRWLARAVLTDADDFEVVAEAGDGAEAVAQVATHQPDMVLLDLAMPVLDGLDAIPGILEAAPGILIVAFSGFSAATVAEEAIARGAHAFIEKGLINVALPGLLRTVRTRAATGPPLVATADIAS